MNVLTPITDINLNSHNSYRSVQFAQMKIFVYLLHYEYCCIAVMVVYAMRYIARDLGE